MSCCIYLCLDTKSNIPRTSKHHTLKGECSFRVKIQSYKHTNRDLLLKILSCRDIRYIDRVLRGSNVMTFALVYGLHGLYGILIAFCL